MARLSNMVRSFFAFLNRSCTYTWVAEPGGRGRGPRPHVFGIINIVYAFFFVHRPPTSPNSPTAVWAPHFQKRSASPGLKRASLLPQGKMAIAKGHQNIRNTYAREARNTFDDLMCFIVCIKRFMMLFIAFHTQIKTILWQNVGNCS